MSVLEDKYQIEETAKRLVYAIDTHQWALAKEQFCDEVTLDYTSLFGGEAEVLPSRVIIERWSSFLPKLKVTQHTLSNFLVEVKGQEATCHSYVDGFHYLPNNEGDDFWNVKGAYVQRLVRISDQWKISHMKLVAVYQSGNRRLLEIAQSMSS